jgi:hypothetical protein
MNIGWSEFAKQRHQKGMGYSYFDGSDSELHDLIMANWDKRFKGDGVESADDVCIVPVDPEKFVSTTIHIDNVEELSAKKIRRQPKEHYFARVEATGETVPCKFARVVLYAAHELLKNDGNRSCEAEWEIVCLIASPIENEPMKPLAAARNMLNKPGGTPRQYTAEYLAECIWYWSQHVSVKAEE